MMTQLPPPPTARTRAPTPQTFAADVAVDNGNVAFVHGSPVMSIPFLRPGALVAVIGPRAHEAVASLRAIAGSDGVGAIDFSPCVWVEPELLAGIQKEAARLLGAVALTVPLPNAWQATRRVADLVVLAPENVGNRVWFVVDGDAFSVLLPDAPALRGALPRQTHRIAPTVH
jgi:hypothetical protein